MPLLSTTAAHGKADSCAQWCCTPQARRNRGRFCGHHAQRRNPELQWRSQSSALNI
jgi:hypothetical protein